MPLSESTLAKLHGVFGFEKLREGQEAVIERLLGGRSVLAVFPTGAGKSLCYQLPALEFPELTLVVSPLLALMKDQIDFLKRKGIAAERLDSTQSLEEHRRVMDDLSNGRLRLLYVSPERMNNERFLATLRRLRIALLAIDEVHCVSEWGHNFRPDYLKLARLCRDLKIPRVLGLTATATRAVADDIARSFGIDSDCVVRTGFYRPNLKLHVTPCDGDRKTRLLVQRLREQPRGPTIVYVTLQRTAEDVSSAVEHAGFPCKAYHAGLESEIRALIQDWFMASQDAVVVATIAFGMGIDKSNIRAVYHYNLPKTLENYAQEIGRAGRDGLDSPCELLASAADRVALENLTFGDTPESAAIELAVGQVLSLGEQFDLSVFDLSRIADIRPLVLETMLTYMELDGVLAQTGHYYSEYKFQPLRPSAQILAKFDPGRAEFLRRMLAKAKPLKTWYRIDVDQCVKELKEPRDRIVSALNYLEAQGDLRIQAGRALTSYRLLKRPVRDELVRTLSARFEHREKRDLERLGQVVEFAMHDGCKTRFLNCYFGEELASDCGHCGWCLGDRNVAMPPAREQPVGPREADLIRRLRQGRSPALERPRQMARYLCGMASPMTTYGKLTREPSFGALTGVPFEKVLALVESPKSASA